MDWLDYWDRFQWDNERDFRNVTKIQHPFPMYSLWYYTSLPSRLSPYPYLTSRNNLGISENLTLFPVTLTLHPYLSQQSRILTIIRGLKRPIFPSSLNVIVQLGNDDSVGDCLGETKLQLSKLSIHIVNKMVGKHTAYFQSFTIFLSFVMAFSNSCSCFLLCSERKFFHSGSCSTASSGDN
jgi:hypothetical protein